MSAGSGIEWTDATWNPVTGCTRVSAGCDHCYAVKQTYRLEQMGQKKKYGSLTVLNSRGERHFNGQVKCHRDELGRPYGWKRPRRVFVNSMSDLFHKDVPFKFIADCFTTMAQANRHTYQILTKRPERALEFFKWNYPTDKISREDAAKDWLESWPNVWIGTSVEDQVTADKRIPHLLKVPVAVRFLSVEPMIGPVDLTRALFTASRDPSPFVEGEAVDWVIVGGESGHGARPMNIEWARSIIEQCSDAGVMCFVKQLGVKPYDPAWHGDGTPNGSEMQLNDPEGGDWDEWPADLRVREFPKATVLNGN